MIKEIEMKITIRWVIDRKYILQWLHRNINCDASLINYTDSEVKGKKMQKK